MEGTYSESLLVREGLQQYFSLFKLGNGGYDSPVFKIKFIGPIRLTLPNTSGRIEAVKLHDIHHVLNEYEARLKGEAEIGAWEIASGCGKYYAAWLLNFGALLYGIFLWPRLTFRAFVKGRRCLNLYHGTEYNNELLSMTVGALRNMLHINNDAQKINTSDIFVYTFWVLLCLAAIISPAVIIYFFIKIIL